MDTRHKKRQRNRQFERARDTKEQINHKAKTTCQQHTQDPAKQTTTTTARQPQPAQGTAASSDKTQTANKPGPIGAVHVFGHDREARKHVVHVETTTH